jgi:hypothetical protein
MAGLVLIKGIWLGSRDVAEPGPSELDHLAAAMSTELGRCLRVGSGHDGVVETTITITSEGRIVPSTTN